MDIIKKVKCQGGLIVRTGMSGGSLWNDVSLIVTCNVAKCTSGINRKLDPDFDHND